MARDPWQRPPDARRKPGLTSRTQSRARAGPARAQSRAGGPSVRQTRPRPIENLPATQPVPLSRFRLEQRAGHHRKTSRHGPWLHYKRVNPSHEVIAPKRLNAPPGHASRPRAFRMPSIRPRTLAGEPHPGSKNPCLARRALAPSSERNCMIRPAQTRPHWSRGLARFAVPSRSPKRMGPATLAAARRTGCIQAALPVAALRRTVVSRRQRAAPWAAGWASRATHARNIGAQHWRATGRAGPGRSAQQPWTDRPREMLRATCSLRPRNERFGKSPRIRVFFAFFEMYVSALNCTVGGTATSC